MLRTSDKELVCPRCGDVVARAHYRPLAGALTVTGLDGFEIPPLGGAVRVLERELASGAEEADVRERIEFLRRNESELVYELRCPRDHRTLCTPPLIIRAMRRTKGRWVRPGG